jgi:hypothetical protein
VEAGSLFALSKSFARGRVFAVDVVLVVVDVSKGAGKCSVVLLFGRHFAPSLHIWHARQYAVRWRRIHKRPRARVDSDDGGKYGLNVPEVDAIWCGVPLEGLA